MIRSFEQLQRVNPGFDSENVMTMTLAVARSKFPTPARQVAFYRRVPRARPNPARGPVGRGCRRRPTTMAAVRTSRSRSKGAPGVGHGGPTRGGRQNHHSGLYEFHANPDCARARFQRCGRGGKARGGVDQRNHGPRILARGRPHRQAVDSDLFPGIAREIVGVVGDVKMDALDQTRPSLLSLHAAGAADAPFPSLGGWESFSMILVMRSASKSEGMVSAATSAIREIDPELPLRDILSMDEVMAKSIGQQRFNMLLLGGFGMLALFLAAIGIYSVLSYSVRRRLQEIGIRLALGAKLGDVLRMVVVEGMKPVAVGVALGVAGAFALGRVLASLIFSVRPTDPITFLAAAALLALISFLACMIPAYRATRVDPIAALRYE